MDPVTTAGLVTAGGSLLGSIGNIFGGRSARKAQKAAAAAMERQNNTNLIRQNSALAGFGNSDDILIAARPLTGNAAVDAPVLAARARMDERFPGVYDVLQREGNALNATLDTLGSKQVKDSRTINSMAAGLEGAGLDLEQRQNEIARREGDRALANANDRASASLNLFGPNTILSSVLGNNARQSQESVTDALTQNAGTAYNRFANARSNRINIFGQRSAMDGSVLSGNANTRYQVNQAPAMVRLQGLGAGAFSPSAAPQPAAFNPWASALQGIGGAMTTMGASGMFSQVPGAGNGATDQPGLYVRNAGQREWQLQR